MRNRELNVRVTSAVAEFAAAAYDYLGELASPAPDLGLRATYRQRLIDADMALTPEDRSMLRSRSWQ